MFGGGGWGGEGLHAHPAASQVDRATHVQLERLEEWRAGGVRGRVLSSHKRRIQRPSGYVSRLAPTRCDVFEVLGNDGWLRPVDRRIYTAGAKFRSFGKDSSLERI